MRETASRPDPGVVAPLEETLLARFDRPRVDDPVRLAVLADAHLATRAEGSWKVLHRTEAALERAIDDLGERSLDGVLVAGDLTKDGEARNFDRYESLIERVDAPTATVPGNHDVPKAGLDHSVMSVEAFADRFCEHGLPARRSFGGVDVLLLNTATHPHGRLRTSAGGVVAASQREWLDDALASAETPIVLQHHPVMALPEHERFSRSHFTLRDADATLDILAAHEVPLVLSGHHHLPAVNRERGVREMIAPALCSFPRGYLLVEVEPVGTTVRFVPVETRDAAFDVRVHGAAGNQVGRAVMEWAEHRLARAPLVDERTEE
ncbi:Calcineurin-like phosphoesterase [Natronoarchaeum philippinense]|uniref:Calcineurin-like phosphoesterase n=1 Tax=Natronoarchaeum philippinense TaxID=558529 RepID=A0A285NFS1_NATPI|nr:metallophosphoesterase [Natronoarchaeum philippinense]SNZ06736.1 Calcineurin-like phosphoesterase [Natronoarchaeum philippinense]